MTASSPASESLPRVGAEGTFHAWCMVLALPRSAAQAIVPRGLVLGPQPLTPADSHPALLMMGHHTGVRPTFLPLPGARYREIALIVPWLHPAGTDPETATAYAHLPKLYLTKWPWVVAGWLYALPKWRARIRDADARYTVATWLRGKTLLEGRFRPYGAEAAPSDFPAFQRMAPLFEQALRQRFPPLPWLASRMVFELDRSRMRAAEAEVTIQSSFLRHLPAGTFRAEGIDRSPLGAFRLEAPWRLSLPRVCSLGSRTKNARSKRKESTTVKRIAVLGGGCGSMATVWALTRLPNWQERFDITVYQVGWRLGGKCASGRNDRYGQRIEEHGLHVWAGFYENGFRLMQEAYGEASPAPHNPIQTWEDAFRKHSAVILEEYVDGEWKHWPLTFPENDAVPGTGGELPTLWQYVELLLDFLRDQLRGVLGDAEAAEGELSRAMAEHLKSAKEGAARSAGFWARLRGELSGEEAAPEEEPAPDLSAHSALDTLKAARHLASALHPDPKQHHAMDHQRLLHLVGEGVKRFEERAETEKTLSDAWRRVKLVANFAHATIAGLIRDGVVLHGFEAINDIEWRAWLKKHGARPATLDSAITRAIYDYVFGYSRGRRDDAQMEAGTATHGMLRLFFTYKGALFWEMQAGMGDIVFAPLYSVLREKGVKFRFFHRVESLHLSADRQRVERIELTRQATVKQGEFDPLIRVKGVPSWPSAPDYDQLIEGDVLEREGIDLESAWSPWKGVEAVTLRQGSDFDAVVLGMSLGAVDIACQELAAANEDFRQMVENVKTVQTGAMQLWIDRDTDAIGAPTPPRITSGYAQDLNTWSDMTFLLPREDWPAEAAPRYLAYFCGEFPDAETIPPFSEHGFPAEELARFRRAAIEWLDRHVGHIWPGATRPDDPDGLDWSVLHDPDGGDGEQRLDAQYLRVNIDPTQRYVLSLPDTSKYRLRAGASGFENLVLAGDWVLTSINAGCVEAAVMAGYDAAAALSGDEIEVIGGLKR